MAKIELIPSKFRCPDFGGGSSVAKILFFQGNYTSNPIFRNFSIIRGNSRSLGNNIRQWRNGFVAYTQAIGQIIPE